MMRNTRFFYFLILMITVALASPLAAQVQTEVPAVAPGAKPVRVERIKIHGTALEVNLEGNAVDRDVLVFLPPSYARAKSRRYPVVYALHGYSIGAEQWGREIHVPQTIEGAFALGAQEVIVVLPDSKTVHNGTIRNRSSRGLVGHSMGGYGATRIGMKHADVFGSLYIVADRFQNHVLPFFSRTLCFQSKCR